MGEFKEKAALEGRSVEGRKCESQAMARPENRRSFKEAILAMPDVGEDADFARQPARSRRVRL